MLRLSLAARRAGPACAFRAVARSFANDYPPGSDGLIPRDIDQQTGRRAHELALERKGIIAHNRDPITPPADQGTKANPILVPSAFHERVVGYEDPDVGQMVWFTLEEGPLHYIPDIDLYFKLLYVGHLADDESIDVPVGGQIPVGAGSHSGVH
ncbi:hypothetical protein M885DRAFT_548838 [Pelagophyceae sp. CCMP2097]|nr:hypothetical protein M885DRAFT_548838 [Pelagophyceae sp. CCMP2097]